MAGKVEPVSSPCIALRETLALRYERKRRNVNDAALCCAYLTLRYVRSVKRPLLFSWLHMYSSYNFGEPTLIPKLLLPCVIIMQLYY